MCVNAALERFCFPEDVKPLESEVLGQDVSNESEEEDQTIGSLKGKISL